VFKNFQEFIQEKIIREAAGASTHGFEIAADFEALAVLLTFIQDGNSYKERVLNWIMGEGLMAASMNREKLLIDVNKIISGEDAGDEKIMFPGNKPLLKAEMVREPERLFGFDQDNNELTVHDLFSPEARARIPILQQIDEELLMPGKKTIDQYWLEKYEPKFIVINPETVDNDHRYYDLEKIRKIVSSKGLKPFYYGGVDGFMQWIEKGEWRPRAARNRSVVNPNRQDGISISPEKQDGKILDDVVSWTKDKEGNTSPIYHFQGGFYTVNNTRAGEVVRMMQDDFKRIAKEIESGTATDEEQNQNKKIWDLAKKTERDAAEALEGKYINGKFVPTKIRGARQGIMAAGAAGKTKEKIPPDISPAALQEKIVKGLSYPFGLLKSQSRWGTNSMLWNQSGMEQVTENLLLIDKNGKETINQEVLNQYMGRREGWYYITPNNTGVIFQFSKQQQDEIAQKILQEFAAGYYLKRLRLNGLKSFAPSFFIQKGKDQTEEKIPTAANVVLHAAKILNNYYDWNKEDKIQATVTSYQLHGIDPSEYTGDVQNVETNLSANANAKNDYMDDKILNDLIGKGFTWEGKHEAGEHPFLKPSVAKAFLSNGVKRFLIERRVGQNGQQYFVLIQPATERGSISDNITPRQARSLGSGGLVTWRSKDAFITSGEGGHHISGNAMGAKDWQYLLTRLKRGCGGGLGETERKGGCVDVKPSTQEEFYNLTDLPSVRGAVRQAMTNFNQNHNSERKKFELYGSNLGGTGEKGTPASYFEINDLLTWAVRGLHLWSNDRAYQVGWITPLEYETFIGDYHTKGGKKSKKINHQEEFWKQEVFQKNIPIDQKEKIERLKKTRQPEKLTGFGFLALMAAQNAISSMDSTPEQRESILEALKDWFEERQNSKEIDPTTGEPKLLIDYMWGVNKAVGAAAAKAGFEFRKRMIGKYVLQQMDMAWKAVKDNLNQTGYGQDGEGGEIEPGQEGRVRSLDYTQIDKQNLTQDDLKQMQQQGTLVAPKTKGIAQGQTRPQIQQQVEPDDDVVYDPRVKKFVPRSPQQVVASRPSTPNPQIQQQVEPDDDVVYDPRVKKFVPRLPQQATVQQRPKVNLDDLDLESTQIKFNIKLSSFSEWRKKIQEMVGTYAIINPRKKPKDGDGYNVWGAAGKSGGVSITGEADSSEDDPDGEKDRRHGRKKRRR
jgi:hypothetical protein